MATYRWTGSSGDWNTAADWTPVGTPGLSDTVLIAPTIASPVMVSIGTSDAAATLGITLNAVNATLEIDGTLNAAGGVIVNAGVLSVKGDLVTSAITDNATIVCFGLPLLNATPLALAGTLQIAAPNALTAATLTLGTSEVVTQTASVAVLDSTLKNSEAIINEGTIIAAVAGGSLTIVPFNFVNAGLINVTNENLSIGYDDGRAGGVRGTWSNSGTIALSGSAAITLDGSILTSWIGSIVGASSVTLAGTMNNIGATLDVGSGSMLGTVVLTRTGLVNGGTIVDGGNGFIENGGTFNAVSYRGPLTIGDGGSLVVTGGIGAGTITVTGGVIDFQNSQTLDNTTIALNGASQLDVGVSGMALTLGPHGTIVSATTGADAVIASNGADSTTFINRGSIIATAAGGGFTIAAAAGFTNQGVISIGAGESFTIAPGTGVFTNSKSASVVVGGAGTLCIADSGTTTPISNAGVITLQSGATLDLSGYFNIPSLGSLINQGAVIEVDGTFDGGSSTLALGNGTELGQMLLAGTLRNATIAPHAAFSIQPSGSATLQNVVWQAPPAITESSLQLTLNEGVVITDASGDPGTLTLSGAGDTLRIQNSASNNATQTLDAVSIIAGNASSAVTIAPSLLGGRFVLGPDATIVSSTPGALLDLAPGNGTSVDIQGTIAALANGGTVTLSGINSGPLQSHLTNDGTILLGFGDALNVATPVSGHGTLDFIGAGTLILDQPGSFTTSIVGFAGGDTIDLPGIAADTAAWSPGQLTISDAGTVIATLPMQGTYAGVFFHVVGDSAVIACLAAGTRILTTRGEVAIEALREGDMVITLAGNAQPIRAVHDQHGVATPPIRIAPHAFGMRQPKRPLLLSPDHAVFFDGMLIPIRYLVNDTTIARTDANDVRYFHVELLRHDVMLAEGLPVESYLGARDSTGWEANGYAPLVICGEAVQRTRAMLRRRGNPAVLSRRRAAAS
jgi:Hint domain